MTTNYPHYIFGNAYTKLEMNESQTKNGLLEQCVLRLMKSAHLVIFVQERSLHVLGKYALGRR